MLAVHLSGWPDDLNAELFCVPHVGRGVPRALMRALTSFVVNVRVTNVSYQVALLFAAFDCVVLVVLVVPDKHTNNKTHAPKRSTKRR